MDRHPDLTLIQSIETLSFKEYFDILSSNTSKNLSADKAFKRYLYFGSLPKVIELETSDEILEYAEDKYDVALLKGIAAVRPRTNMRVYLSLLSYIVQNIGSLMSPGALVGELEKRGTNIAKNTIVEYLKLACISGFFCRVQRIDLKTDIILSRGEKYYLKDFGFKYFVEKRAPKKEEYEVLVENAIFLELSRRYETVLVGKLGRYTIDFVCSGKNSDSNGCAKRHYYQIVRDPFEFDIKEDKVYPLLTLRDNYPKTLLTLDQVEADCVAGVKCEYVIDWLLK